jgi:hypothetical protein
VLTRIFRIGPVLLLPLIILWGQVCYQTGTYKAHQQHDWWRSYPIYAAFAGAAIWHRALVVTEEKWRLHYIIYAIAHLPILFLTSEVSLIYATLAPL